MVQTTLTSSEADRTHAKVHSHSESHLGSFLCWAVVFANIGTSIYYVPGILYGNFGNLAGFFVFLTMSVFVLLTLKYAEVTARFPQGGGVITVGAQAFNHWVGALGGMFILVDYFLGQPKNGQKPRLFEYHNPYHNDRQAKKVFARAKYPSHWGKYLLHRHRNTIQDGIA